MSSNRRNAEPMDRRTPDDCLARVRRPHLWFLFIGSRVCSAVPSDPISRSAPLRFSNRLPRSGPAAPSTPSCLSCSADIRNAEHSPGLLMRTLVATLAYCNFKPDRSTCPLSKSSSRT